MGVYAAHCMAGVQEQVSCWSLPLLSQWESTMLLRPPVRVVCCTPLASGPLALRPAAQLVG